MNQGDYAKFKECNKIQNANKRLLSDFAISMQNAGLAQKTIQKHVDNIDFYINEFLLYEEPIEAKDGALRIGFFLSYWFPRKAMWASPDSVKGNAASLKKFYSFLHSKGLTEIEDLEDLKQALKENMAEWLENMKQDDISFW